MIIDPDFVDHWKWHSIAAELDVEHADIVVLMIRIWSHCQQRRADTFPGLSNKALATLCRFDGDPDSLFRSLETHGFLSKEPNGALRILKWSEYNASLLANWVNGRKGGRPKGSINGTAKPSKNRGQKPMGSERVNPNGTDKSREEKRRLEKNNPLKSPKGDEWFDRFWDVVHVKKGKDKARTAFTNAVKRLAPRMASDRQKAAEFITERMAAFAQTPDARPEHRSPIHPSTWLNEGRFHDEDDDASSSSIPDGRPLSLAEAAATPSRGRSINGKP